MYDETEIECPACYEKFRQAVLADPHLGRHFAHYEKHYRKKQNEPGLKQD